MIGGINRFVLYLALAISLVSLTLAIIPMDRVAHIDSVRLYNGFLMKKELEKELSINQKSRRGDLDSLLNKIENLQKSTQSAHLVSQLREQYLLLEARYDKENEEMISNYQSQIWKQLNQYIKDFGDKYEYSLIWGASGDGSLVYSAEGNDITQELLDYVNARYNDNR
jgi:outer membrane protein